MRRPPTLYFSFRSPFTWMAVERLRRAVPDFDERVRMSPYWDPDPQTEEALRARGAGFHYVQMTKAKHLYILHDTKRMAARLGLSMAWPVDVDPWWEVPHLAWLAARREGAGREFYSAVMAARWERGEDVCDPTLMRAIGDRLGLNGETLAAATDNPELRAEGVDRLVQAWEDDVFGVPYFRMGHHRFWGLDRVDHFLEVFLGEAAPEAAAPEFAGVRGAYDADTAGGCG